MTAAVLQNTLSQTIFRFVIMVGLAAAIVGGALSLRDPYLPVRPFMAEHPVILPDGAVLYVQKYEVSIAEWNMCHTDGACTQVLHAPRGKLEATTPATGLSHLDAREYLSWINRAGRHDFRLPNLEEWQFMAADVLPEDPDPIFTSPDLTWASSYLTEPQTKRALHPQGSFATTTQGIVDLDGNVWEWTSECFAGVSGGDISSDRCPAYYIGGEHIAAMSYLIRDPARGGCAVGSPPAHLGMRLVSDHAF